MGRRGIIRAGILGVLLGFATANAMLAQGQNPPAATLLTLNQERLFSASLFGERVAQELEESSKLLATENREIEAGLIAEEKALTEQRKTLEPAEFRILADAFDEKVQGIRHTQEEKSRELGLRLEQEQARFFNQIVPILGQIMKERGAVAIVSRRAIILSADSIDITDDAVRAIDATLGDGRAPPTPE